MVLERSSHSDRWRGQNVEPVTRAFILTWPLIAATVTRGQLLRGPPSQNRMVAPPRNWPWSNSNRSTTESNPLANGLLSVRDAP